MLDLLSQNKGKNVDITFYRDGKEQNATVAVDQNGKIGISLTPIYEMYPLVTKHFGFWESFPVGISKGFSTLKSYVGDLKYIFTKEGANSLGGFGTIGSIFPSVWNWASILGNDGISFHNSCLYEYTSDSCT